VTSRGRVVIAGAVAQRPARAGHAWVYLQYLLGFRRLGWEVLFIDWLEPEMCVDASGRACPVGRSENLRYLDALMREFGLGRSYALLDPSAGTIFGISRLEARRQVADADFLINVMGYLKDEDLLALSRRRVFLDIDPGFTQMWRELGLADLLDGHDAFVTVGEAVGTAGCSIPTCGIDWIRTPQPVLLDEWPVAQGESSTITGIGSWRGNNAPITYEGRHYGLRVHEFRQFADLPKRSGRDFEYALDIHPSETADFELLRAGGWRLVDPLGAAATPSAYRDYIQGSFAELMVAKGMYVSSRSGWFSDRSICYLASGRPVLAQDTGRCETYDAGLLTIDTLDGAVAAIEEVCSDYPRHRRAAREIAESRYDSDVVLGRLLNKVGAT
jgi:hypothetical protein